MINFLCIAAFLCLMYLENIQMNDSFTWIDGINDYFEMSLLELVCLLILNFYFTSFYQLPFDNLSYQVLKKFICTCVHMLYLCVMFIKYVHKYAWYVCIISHGYVWKICDACYIFTSVFSFKLTRRNKFWCDTGLRFQKHQQLYIIRINFE